MYKKKPDQRRVLKLVIDNNAKYILKNKKINCKISSYK